MRNYFLFMFVLAGFCLAAQKQANTWYFGNGAGLDFNAPCTPSVLADGAINGFEGCVTMSDRNTGQLLFYCNSEKIWNKNHQVIPNSTLVTPNGNSITQLMAIEKPGSSTRYYIFTTQVQSTGIPGLKLAELDMTLNGGLGGIVFKDSLICKDTLTESITAVKHSNGNDVWVVCHKSNSTHYLSFLVTAGGVNVTPVTSAIGKRRWYNAPTSISDAGEMKVSPNGKKLASVSAQNAHIELFDFNAGTGQITNMIRLPEIGGINSPTNGSASGLYGVSFSSNNNFLYIGRVKTGGVPAQIIQYNISSNDSATINNSRVNIHTSTTKSVYSFKLAPDKKIYVGHPNVAPGPGINYEKYLGVIHSPDNPGINCNYVDSGLYLGAGNKHCNWGLNNLMEYGVYCDSEEPNAIGEHSHNKINRGFYPNPAVETAVLLFENRTGNVCTLYVYNVNGKMVFHKETLTHEVSIEKKDVGSGLFFYELKGSGNIIKGKFLVE